MRPENPMPTAPEPTLHMRLDEMNSIARRTLESLQTTIGALRATEKQDGQKASVRSISRSVQEKHFDLGEALALMEHLASQIENFVGEHRDNLQPASDSGNIVGYSSGRG